MKNHYEMLDADDWCCHKVSAIHRYCLQWRRRVRLHTQQERRESLNDGGASEFTNKNVIRPKRNHHALPTKWDDGRISRNWGRSWKDYTRNRKQWGPNIDQY